VNLNNNPGKLNYVKQICYPFFDMTAKDHYDKHLGNFYSWMTGDFNQRQLSEQKVFQDLGILTGERRLAFDLGAGHGIQSIALANLGYEVKAVDFNRQLLEELTLNRGSLPITVHQQDMREFLETNDDQADLIVCMGDTITHLESLNAIDHLLRLIKKRLRAKGSVVISFRELTTELKGGARFIPVKSDDKRILTCFLDYYPDHVLVHDLLWERGPNGWTQTVSAYPKQRLSSETLEKKMKENKLTVTKSLLSNGMIVLAAGHAQASTQ
jgi:2-polyprenyl-3-methyl-5-hydroxy-6-metoxy-1,4-benzoquinol methylase